MIISETEVRLLIRRKLQEAFDVDKISTTTVGKEFGKSGSEECEITVNTTFPLNSSKTRIEEISEVKTRFARLRTELQAHLRKNGFPNALIGDNGRSRSLNDSAETGGNTARISGSLHGLSLAQDLLIDVGFLGPAGTFKKKGYAVANPTLAKKSDFVKAIHAFNITQTDLTWGGEWNKPGSRSNNAAGEVKGRGITEFHHWELKEAEIKQALASSGYDKHIKALGFTLEDMLSNEKRASMYLKLTGEECVNPEDVDAVADTGTSTGGGLTPGSDDGSDTESTDRVAYNEDSCLEARGTFDASSGVCTIEIDTGEDADGDSMNDYEIITTKFHKKDEPAKYYTA
jgi:hypothetical protein